MTVISDFLAGQELSHNPGELIDLLKTLNYSRYQLVAIHPKDRENNRRIYPEAKIFEHGKWGAMLAWAADNNKLGYGVYFSLNEPRAGLTKKAKDEEIESIGVIAIDIDPDQKRPFGQERQRLAALIEEIKSEPEFYPSVIIDSGGGFQLIWRLSEKIPATPENEAWARGQTRGLVEKYGGDGSDENCINIGRVFRAAGTINHPNAVKRAHGRTKAPAKLIENHEDHTFTREELAEFAEPIAAPIRKKVDQTPLIPWQDADSDAGNLYRLWLRDCAPIAIEGAGGDKVTLDVAAKGKDYCLTRDATREILLEDGGWFERCITTTRGLQHADEWLAEKVDNGYSYCQDNAPGCDHPLAEFEPITDAELAAAQAEFEAAYLASFPLPPLSIETWLTRDLPEPDWLMGKWLSTTARGLLIGPTGLGKTNFGLALAMHTAAGRDFLNWKSYRPARVLYCDGEMPRRLFRERIADAARWLGEKPATFFAVSNEDLENFPPLNTKEGQARFEKLISHIKPDLIIFDSIMALTIGDLKDPEAWQRVMPWVRSLTKRNIGQIWLHHTGLEKGRGYGDSTREWQLDLVMLMTKLERANADVAFSLEFTKKRECTPATRADFANVEISLAADQWTATGSATKAKRQKLPVIEQSFFEALTATIAKSDDRITTTDKAWEKTCLDRGLLPDNPHSVRTLMPRHRMRLIAAGYITWDNGRISIASTRPAIEEEFSLGPDPFERGSGA